MAQSKYSYRKTGPSGHGEGRVNYYADDRSTFRFICAVEGKPGDWRVRRVYKGVDLGPYKTRDEAVDAFVKEQG